MLLPCFIFLLLLFIFVGWTPFYRTSRHLPHASLDMCFSCRIFLYSSGEFACGRLHGYGTAQMFDGSTYTGATRFFYQCVLIHCVLMMHFLFRVYNFKLLV